MKIPKNYFNNLSANKYREYLKLLPNMEKENTRIVVTLIFTFFALSFFGIFAINPTLTTIVELKRKHADSLLIYEGLKVKTSSLASLQSQYNTLTPEIPIILEAIPQNPDPTVLLAQINGLAEQKNVSLISLETSNVTLMKKSNSPTVATEEINLTQDDPSQSITIKANEENSSQNSFNFTLQVQGSYETLIEFATSISKIQRVVEIESMSINIQSDPNNLVMDVGGRAYFIK